MNKLTFLLLGLVTTSVFAGNYADNGDVPDNNKEKEHHFYVDLGVNEYYFNQPSMVLPYAHGAQGNPSQSGTPFPTGSDTSYDADKWSVNPSITLGYQFLTDNADLQKIFGQQNAIELRASYFHSTGTQDENYDDQPYYIANYPITGGAANFTYPATLALTDASTDFENTYENIGLYYTGNKIISNTLISSPYVGVDFSYLKQDSNYTTTEWGVTSDGQVAYGDPAFVGTGYDNLSSYYMGVAFGDKLTWLFKDHYGAYGILGGGVYWLHTKLDAGQTPVTNEDALNTYDFDVFPGMLASYYDSIADDTYTFKLKAEVGLSYYFTNNQNPMNAHVTLLVGLDYWNDVAYADNPTATGETLQIGYASALNPYAGLQLHIPL